jgi:hypothetical protein
VVVVALGSWSNAAAWKRRRSNSVVMCDGSRTSGSVRDIGWICGVELVVEVVESCFVDELVGVVWSAERSIPGAIIIDRTC